MSDDWISLPDAIEKVAKTTGMPPEKAIPYLLSLTHGTRVESRIALVADHSADQSERNVRMSVTDWLDLENLPTNWLTTGNAEWKDGYTWLGIEIRAGDLAMNLRGKERQEREADEPTEGRPKRKLPGPKPHRDWSDAIEKVTQECIAEGYAKPLKRGDKAAIQTLLLNYMADRENEFSDSTAAKYAKRVIDALPHD